MKLGAAADFLLDISETDLSTLTASIKAPSGRDEPCLLKRLPNNHIGEGSASSSSWLLPYFSGGGGRNGTDARAALPGKSPNRNMILTHIGTQGAPPPFLKQGLGTHGLGFHGSLSSPETPLFLFLSGISFIPREVGEHLVSIKKNGSHVANSPVSIMVVQSEIGDARRAKVSGRGLTEGRTFEMSDFIVDTRDAGQCACFSSAREEPRGFSQAWFPSSVPQSPLSLKGQSFGHLSCRPFASCVANAVVLLVSRSLSPKAAGLFSLRDSIAQWIGCWSQGDSGLSPMLLTSCETLGKSFNICFSIFYW